MRDSILTKMGIIRELRGKVAKLKLQYFGHVARGCVGHLPTVIYWLVIQRAEDIEVGKEDSG